MGNIKRTAVISLLIFTGLLVYLNTLHGEFITLWDDNIYVVNNTVIRDLSLQSIYKIFTTPHYTDYYPVQILSYAIDYRIWGLNPYGYHLTALLIHILNSILVYILFQNLIANHTKLADGAKEAVAATGAFIFLAHPTNLETVAWVTERKNLLSMTFYILSFFFYSKYKLKMDRFWRDISLVAFLLALLSKSSVVILPLVLLFYELIFFSKNRNRRSLLYDMVPFFIMAGIFSAVTTLVHSNVGAIYDYPKGKPLNTIFTMLNVYVLYTRNSLFPFNLSPFYSTIISESILEPTVLVSASIMMLIIAYTLYLWPRYKLMFFCMPLFFLPLLPVSHIIPIAIYITDRYLYLPLVGFSLLMALSLYRAIESFCFYSKVYRNKAVIIYLFVSLYIVSQLSTLAVKQGDVWQDGVSVWAKVVKENPLYAGSYLQAGAAYLQKKNYVEAYVHATRALELNKGNKIALYNRAIFFIFNKDLTRGERELERLRKIDPDYPLLFYGLGIFYINKGDLENALESFEKFVTLYKLPYNNYEIPVITDANEAIKKIKEIQGERGK